MQKHNSQKIADLRIRKQNELMIPMLDDFINNISNDDILQITSKLVKNNCLTYSRKKDIMEASLTTTGRADKLFDYVYNSDITTIDRFLHEVKCQLPQVYRIIEDADEKLKSESAEYYTPAGESNPLYMRTNERLQSRHSSHEFEAIVKDLVSLKIKSEEEISQLVQLKNKFEEFIDESRTKMNSMLETTNNNSILIADNRAKTKREQQMKCVYLDPILDQNIEKKPKRKSWRIQLKRFFSRKKNFRKSEKCAVYIQELKIPENEADSGIHSYYNTDAETYEEIK